MVAPDAVGPGGREHPLRILLFSQHFWPESFRINDVAQSLQAAGHRVTVLTGQPNYPGGTVFDGYRAAACVVEPYRGVQIHRVPLLPRGRGGALRLAANYLSFIASAATCGAWRLRGQRFDVVFVYATSPLLQALAAIVLARLKSCPLVVWVQDLWPQSLQVTGYVRHPRLLAAVERVVRLVYARCTLLLVQSPAFVEPVRALAPPHVPVRVHANPGDDEVPVDAPPALQLEPGFNAVFAGNLGTAQALDTVLDAAERLRDLPDLRIVLVGSGSRSAWLAEQVRARALGNVQLPGRFAPEQMPGILAQAQALLLTLKDDPAMALTVPSKLQSYFAAGRPVVAAIGGEGARLVREAGAGIACAPGDAAALAAALRSLHALGPAERERLGAAGRRCHAEQFSPRVLTPALLAHLQSAVDAARDHGDNTAADRR
ncbi:MAG: glycosyltransferase family 4 protein [Burkholderiales bacterium]|nr:glycosyltransferase family 4 protein [Burkholderiales bacterium]